MMEKLSDLCVHVADNIIMLGGFQYFSLLDKLELAANCQTFFQYLLEIGILVSAGVWHMIVQVKVVV